MKIARRFWILMVAGGLMLALAPASWGQQGTGSGSGLGSESGRTSQTTTPTPSLAPVGPPDLGTSPEMEQEQAKMRNADRQKQLVADTDKLLALANELKVEVGKSTKDTLSVDVIRKADEIEKLAHSVKEKMKGS